MHLLEETQGFFFLEKSTSFYLQDIMNLEVMKVLKLMVFCLWGIDFAFVLYKQHVYAAMLYN